MAGIVDSVMRLIRVKMRRLLGERKVGGLGWLRLVLEGMKRPAEMLEILGLPRTPPRLLLTVLAELLKLLLAQLLGVVSSLRLVFDRRVRGQMLMRRVQRR